MMVLAVSGLQTTDVDSVGSGFVPSIAWRLGQVMNMQPFGELSRNLKEVTISWTYSE